MSSAPINPCPLCGTALLRDQKLPDVSAYDLDCASCGIYRVGGATRATLNVLRDAAFIRSHVARIAAANKKGLLYHFPSGTLTTQHPWLLPLHQRVPALEPNADDERAVFESQTWDKDVLEQSAIASVLRGDIDPTSVQDTDPLAQVLLILQSAADPRMLDALVRQRGGPLSLIDQALRVYDGTSDNTARLAPHNRSYAWLALGAFPLEDQTPVFAYRIAEALRDIGAVDLLAETPRQHLNNLLFQPLQNAEAYGRTLRTKAQRRQFGGLVLRVVDEAALNGPTKRAYRESLKTRRSPKGFLEAIVHDDGPGIAAHFFAAHQGSHGSLYERDLAWEWTSLQHAFERHLSSRPRYLERRVNQQAFEPGIGLFAVLSALKALDGYMEVRCGRLRLYRYLLRDIPFRVDEPLLHPSHFQETAAPLIAGTILRFLLPLETLSV